MAGVYAALFIPSVVVTYLSLPFIALGNAFNPSHLPTILENLTVVIFVFTPAFYLLGAIAGFKKKIDSRIALVLLLLPIAIFLFKFSQFGDPQQIGGQLLFLLL